MTAYKIKNNWFALLLEVRTVLSEYISAKKSECSIYTHLNVLLLC